MLNDPNVKLPIAPRIISINDTQYYNIADEDKPYIESIHNVYLYDKNSRTFCCEITPSYSLIYLYTSVHFAGDPDEETRERIYDKYEANNGDDTYLHCYGLDDIEKEHTSRKITDPIKFPDFYIGNDIHFIEDDETYDEAMESTRESYSCNHVI